MARPKEFDKQLALDAAIGVFREHGFEGTSTEMLVGAMRVGRQSLYDTFGDKWQLYSAAVSHHSTVETQTHIAILRNTPRAIDGIRAMVERVVADAHQACLGVGSICEFGSSRTDLTEIHDTAGKPLLAAITARTREAQADGDVGPELDAVEVARFLSASFAGIRIAARGGADDRQLQSLGQLALRALK
jgi:AcrR family transcriptional regulator